MGKHYVSNVIKKQILINLKYSNMQNNKPIWYSTTFWFGALQVLLGILGLISGKMDAQAAQAIIITGIGTIGFRVKTNTGITLS